jgi:hypothetical protein
MSVAIFILSCEESEFHVTFVLRECNPLSLLFVFYHSVSVLSLFHSFVLSLYEALRIKGIVIWCVVVLL